MKPYHPGYTASRPNPEETTIGKYVNVLGHLWICMILTFWQLQRLRQLLEAEYNDCNATNASGAAFCNSAALIHALAVTDGDGEDEPSTIFSFFLFQATGFLSPCYIMIWAIIILQCRRQRQEAAGLAATQFAFVVQFGQSRGMHFAIAFVAPVPAPATAMAS